uniref:GATA-type domain-containing protein n=1 Tax=Chlamydomonas leiostraca TaxID=1034604 RepID=A0A7S0WRZ3_9CHLO|mmetsp:Transcript_25734/g.65426  ORF Transcript_25734/g.65426 Transcript_25734/m.65426 type:complete len:419 (+) Transcript_25734:248-1504(+)
MQKRTYDDAFPASFKPEQATAVMEARSPKAGGKIRSCFECGATDTPQWRQGPAGARSLCNACGVRHSRHVRKAGKGKAKSGGHHSPGTASWDECEDSEDTNSEDTSKGTTIAVHHPVLPPLYAGAASPAVPASPVSSAPSLLTHGARRVANMGAARSLSMPTSGLPACAVPASLAPHSAPAESDEHEDSEAGLILLSMAHQASTAATTASPARTVSVGTPASRPPPTAALAAQLAAQAQAQAPAPPADLMSQYMSSDTLAQLMPHLGPAQVAELRALCAAFDSSYQELVSAHAACEAVGKILTVKAQQAGAMRAAARHVIEGLVVQASEAVRGPEVRQALAASLSAASSGAAAPTTTTTGAAGTSSGTVQPAARQQVVDDTAASEPERQASATVPAAAASEAAAAVCGHPRLHALTQI